MTGIKADDAQGIQLKSVPAVVEYKALGDDAPVGSFQALFAVYGNVDSWGDRILPGAFNGVFDEYGFPPCVWGHRWDIPPIGGFDSIVETEEGPVVSGFLLVADGEDHSYAKMVHAGMRRKDGNGHPVVREFSFAYDVAEVRYPDDDEKVSANHWRDIVRFKRIYEIGPVLVGANDQTRLEDAKHSRRGRDGDPTQEPSSSVPTIDNDTASARRARQLLTDAT